MIIIKKDVAIDPSELVFTASRSSGPGGQNVNKVNTRITLRFDIEASSSLTPEQKDKVCQRLASRINKDGILQLSAEDQRRQGANRQAAIDRFAELLRAALTDPPKRRATRIPRRLVERRLENKRRTSEKKKGRSSRYDRGYD